MIEVKLIADSISGTSRLTTLECKFHRFILPEVNTYRMWSRSAASSRAIPVSRKIEEVRKDPAMPSKFGLNKKGMVSGRALEGEELQKAQLVWLESSIVSANYAEELATLGVAKEITNRILEPYSWHTSVITATDFSNCFAQRIPEESGAQNEFQILATRMRDAMNESVPVQVPEGGWHLPYITEEEILTYNVEDLKMASVARVARTSYLNSSSSIQSDIELYSRLISATPPHLAPFEMIATPGQGSGNFEGWIQLRHMV